MRATVLGTGSALPDGERAQSGLLVRDGATRVLVDCGSGVLERLARTETGVTGLDAVCLTHGHVDHVSDLVALLKARWLAAEDDAAAREADGENGPVEAAESADALPVVGPPGTTELVDGLLDVHDYLAGRVRVDAHDVAGGAFTLAGLDVETYETAHSTSMRSFAYRFGDALTVSGDTPADPDLAAFAAGTTLVHDCSFPDGHASDGHATPRELGRVLAGRNYHGVSLTHRYPDAKAAGDALVAGVREHYDGDVTVAREGETIRCGPTDTE